MVATVELIWAKHNEYIIRDIHEKWHDRVRNFMLEKYFKPHQLFNYLNFQDHPETNKQYAKYIDHIIRDECSIIVLHEETDSIHGVAMLKCMTKELRSWTCLQYCIDECPFMDIVDLQYRTIFEYAAEDTEKVFNNLHLFDYYIENELKSDSEFVKKFFDAIKETARYMKMQRVTCLALSSTDQRDCWEQGFERINRAIYSLFTLGKNRRPFAPLRNIDESEAGLFAFTVTPLRPYTRMKVRGGTDIVQPKPKPKKV